ncbi:NT-3 growth factor receptor [Schistosoma japonicum]|uniref:NT-3 growth factor receptor n=1 Tax=Schistosoma japonicum TaxID=6182 RepID=A0A4Z2DHG5_SCHJA|nr:NT-3 growth factor receptor [Schistosoma japonicum]
MLIKQLLIVILICKISLNILIYQINRNEHNHSYNIPNNTLEIKFSCSFGTKWFIPSTITKQFQPMIKMNKARTQSILNIHLPENNSLHINYRGLYQCCQAFNEYDIGLINWLPNEPLCCPCCPWYEQDYCLFKQIQLNNSSRIILKLKNASIHCGSVFLYTNTINTETVYLNVIRNQPMLIPCPGLNNTFQSNETTIFSIDYQLTPHKSSYQLWYPFKQFNSIQYYYDNRFGLCLMKSQLPRIMLFMLCNYKQINQQRIIQPIWSLPSPVIAPTIHFYLKSMNTIEYNNNYPISFLKNINWFIKYTDDIITFRIMKQITMLQLTCIGSYTQRYIVHKPISKLCFTWRLLNEINEKPSNIYQFHNQSNHQIIWEKIECLSTNQTFKKLSILYAYSNYQINLFKQINSSINQSITNNNTLIQCEITTPDRLASINQKFIQLIQSSKTNVSNQFYINYYCNCKILSINKSISLDQSTINLLINKKTIFNMNITFWTDNEINEQPFCNLIKSNSIDFNQLIQNIQIQLIRTRYTWKCLIKMKLYMPSNTINLLINYGKFKKIFHLFIIQSIFISSRIIENLHSQITQQSNLYCIPNDIEQKIIEQLGYYYPTNIKWFISIDNITQNYTTYNKTFKHSFNLMPIINTTYYSNLVIKKNEYLWKQFNEISMHQSNLFSLYYWPKKLCIKCVSNYEIGLYIDSQEICSIINDFNVDILFNSTTTNNNDEYKQIIQQKKQLYFTIEMNNSTKYYTINSQLNNSIIFLNQGIYVTLECIRHLYIKPKSIKQEEWPVINIINTLNSSNNNNTNDNSNDNINNNNTFRILSPYSMKIKKIISFYKQTIMNIKCSFKHEQYTIKVYPLKQIKPKILKPSNDIQFINNNTFNNNNNNNNITENNLQLKCQVIGSPKPTIQWMKAIYNENKVFMKWEIIHQCLSNINYIQFNMNIENEIHTCTLNISLLLLVMNVLNQSYYQCLAENNIGNALKQIKLIYSDTTYISNTSINNNIKLYVMMKNTIIWIFLIILLISLLFIIFSIVICLCYKINYNKHYSSDISLPNILYKHIYNHLHSYQLKLSSITPSLLSTYNTSKQYKSMEQMLSELLGLSVNDTNNIITTSSPPPTATTTTTAGTTTTTTNNSINQINKWIIPRKFIKLSTYSLGSGHYGSVFKAWLYSSYIKDQLNNQFNDILLKEDIDKYIVAIKASSTSSLVARQNKHDDNNHNHNNLLCLRNEIRILTNLTNCENIIKMIGIMFENKLKRSRNILNNVNLILEYCQYKSLSHFIQYHSYQITDSLLNYEEIQCITMNTEHDKTIIEEYRLTVKELYRFAYGIISGIVYLTRNYVIHRDLATRNILINHNYIPKISDFGLAVQLTPLNTLNNDNIYNIDNEFNEDQLIDEYYRVLTPRKNYH